MAQIELKIGSEFYKLENLPNIEKSSRETVFSDVIIEFTGDINDLPVKLQEVFIVDRDENPDKILFTGFVNNYQTQRFDGNQFRKMLTIELLSPQTYSTKRTITIIEELVSLTDSVNTILQPLVDDGFVILENNLPADIISLKYIFETVEKTMNDMANKYNFFWYIDENKNIFINNIDDLKSNTSVLTISDATTISEFKEVQSKIQAVDYGNTIIVKNFKLYSETSSTSAEVIVGVPFTVEENEIMKFKYPVDISENAGSRIQSIFSVITLLSFTITGLGAKSINYDQDTKTRTINADIGFLGDDDDDASKLILLERDIDLPDVITGFKWNDATSRTITDIFSSSTLIPTTFKYIDPNEIEAQKGIISTSGVVEKSIDGLGRFFTSIEIFEFASSQLTLNNRETSDVELTFQGDETSNIDIIIDDLIIGSKITLDLENEFAVGDFIITETTESIEIGLKRLEVKGRNFNLIENFIDLFRKPMIEENTQQIFKQVNSIFIQDESIFENQEINVNGVVVNEDN